MKIKTKLLIALSTLPLLLVIIIVSGLLQRNTIIDLSNSLLKNYDATILAEEILRDIKDEGISLRNIVVFENEERVAKEIESIREGNKEISNNVASLESMAVTEQQLEMVRELADISTEYNNYSNNVISFIEAGDNEKAVELMGENASDLHQDFSTIIKEITTRYETNMNKEIQTFSTDSAKGLTVSVIIVGALMLLSTILLIMTVQRFLKRFTKVSDMMRKVASGEADLNTEIENTSSDEIGEMVKAFNRMTTSLDEQFQKEQELTWAKTNIANITTSLSGTRELETLAHTFLSNVVPLVGASHAVFYVKDMVEEESNPVFRLLGSYAFKERKHLTNTFRQGEGLIGQAILEKTPIILTDVPSDYIRIQSGLGEGNPVNVYVLPILFEDEVKAVLEIASFKTFTATEQGFLEDLIEDLGIILESVMSRIRLASLLEESQALMEETQAQAEELQSQQDELRATNEELEEQTQALRQSEEKLQLQQNELEETNTDLEEKTKRLEEQNKLFERKNKEVEAARLELEEKAEQLALSSKYKSEFLANMSHELRTPLNSLLILSKLLADNTDGNLSAKQVEFSKTIYSSGNDLLTLINDILDLAKIESGKIEVHPSPINLVSFVADLENSFQPVASEKGLDFTVVLQDEVPTSLYSDEVRVQQVLTNLLSNAFKFTEKGGVVLEVGVQNHQSKRPVIAFSVKDTGIGIPKEKQAIIFEAFQQADGTTSRKFGGTGLGLSISKQSAAMLGGDIKVESVVGLGTTFTFLVGDYVVQQSENNDSMGMEKVAATVEEIAIVPIENNDVEGISGEIDENRHIKRVLIVDDDNTQRNSLMELIGDMDVIIKAVSTGTEAMEELKVNQFDCMILDLGLGDTSGFDLLEVVKETKETANVKVIVYTGRVLTAKEELQLSKHAHTIIIKDEHSPTRLKDELEVFLHADELEEDLVEGFSLDGKKDLSLLNGKKVLLVDDDVRNVFALSSVLEQLGMQIIFAENGVESLEALENTTGIDIVLMDIMMPEMDGYEAIRQIRSNPVFHSLPIIALTAKAMKEDREKCLEAGASDYIVKPIDPDKLVSLIKVWLFPQEGN